MELFLRISLWILTWISLVIYYTCISFVYFVKNLTNDGFITFFYNRCTRILRCYAKYFWFVDLNFSCLSNDFVRHDVPFQVVSAGERRNSIASRAIEHRAATEDGRLGEARSGCISANDSNSETEVVRGTYERRNARNSKEERNVRDPGSGGKRREGGGGGKGWCRCRLRRAKDGGSWLKRQYRRKLIIGLRYTREENKIQASSDCCFQLNPSPRHSPTWMNVLAENNQAPPGATI